MDFKELQYILAIISEGNLSKAAEKLYTTQPSLSRVVSKVEKELDTELFEKAKIPWKLTYAGELFIEHAEQIISFHNHFLRTIEEISNSESGKLNIGITSFGEKFFLSKIFPIFHEKYPKIRTVFFASQLSNLEELILDNSVNFAITSSSPEMHNEIEYIPFKTYDIIVAIPLDHELAKDYKMPKEGEDYPNIDFKLLRDFPFIVPKAHHFLNDLVVGTCKKFNFRAQSILEVHDIDTAHNFVINGYGATFILDELMIDHDEAPKAAYFKVKDTPLSLTIALAYRKGRKLSPIEKAFLEILEAHA